MTFAGITLGHSYKVPHGQELPHAGLYLRAVAFKAGSVEFQTATGKPVSLWLSAAERLAQTADAIRQEATGVIVGEATPDDGAWIKQCERVRYTEVEGKWFVSFDGDNATGPFRTKLAMENYIAAWINRFPVPVTPVRRGGEVQGE